MFNLSGSEIIVILLLALVVLGPEKLPDAMRRAGKTFAELKKLSSGFQDEVRKGFEEPVREIRKTAATVKSAARVTTDTVTGKDKPRFNPETDPTPEPPRGSSVGEPLTDASADAAEATIADASPDAAEATIADVRSESADAEADGTAVRSGVVDDSDGDGAAVVTDAVGDAEITPTAEADRTA